MREPSPTLVGTALSAAAFVLGAAPSVGDRDAGELTTAAFRLDVAHPSGFPLDMVALRLAELCPFGDVASRANLAVGALSALACGLVTHIAWTFCECIPARFRWPAALLPAAAIVCSSTVLRAATAAEVYGSTLAVAALALSLVLLPCAPSERAPRRRLAALVAGCSVALHTSSRPAPFLALALLGVVGLRTESDPLAMLWRRAKVALALGLTGAAIILYLPVAARRRGPINWGDPSTLPGLYRHLTASSIRAAYGARMLVPWRMSEDLGRVVGNLVEDLGVPLLVLALGGVVLALRQRTPRILAAVALADLFFAVAIHPMGTYDRQTLFLAEMSLGLLAAYALGALAGMASQRAPMLAGVLGVALCVATVVRCDLTWAGAADGWSESEMLGGPGALGAVPPRAVVLCASDDLCGGAFYAQWVEGERPDVTVLPRQWLDDPSTWRRLTSRRLGAPVPQPMGPGDLRQRRLRGLIAAIGERLRWEDPEADDARWLGITTGSGESPVLPAVTGPVTLVDADAVRWVTERMPSQRVEREGSGARWVASLVVFGAARRVARVGIDHAVPMWAWTVAMEPHHAPSYTNLGVAAARAGHFREAIALTRRAISLDPERSMAWRNLGDYLANVGDAEGARSARSEARRRTE